MVNPRPWAVVSGALAVGMGMGAAAAAVLSGDDRQSEVVGPGIVLTSEPAGDESEARASRDSATDTAAATDTPDAPTERPQQDPPGQTRAVPSPSAAAPQPVPAPPPAPQPVVVGDSADSASELSADSAD